MIQLETLEGKPVNLTEYLGKPIFMNIWATWCGPCKRELPSIERMRKELEPKGVVFLICSEEDPGLIKRFKETNPYKFTYLRLKTKLQDLNLYSIPVTWLINKKGRMYKSIVGGAEWDASPYRELLAKFSGQP